MKKAPILLILILACFFTAAPYLFGLKIKSEITTFVDGISASSGYNIDVKRYDLGWLSSSGEFSVNINLPNPSNDPQLNALGQVTGLTFDFSLNHGPFVKQSGLGLFRWDYRLQDAEKLRAFAVWEEGIPLYKSSGFVSLNGDIKYQDSIPIISSTENLEEVLSFAIGGYVGFGEVIDGMMFYDGSTGSIEINTVESQISIRPIDIILSMAVDIEKIVNGELYNSYAQLKVEEIDIDGQNPAHIAGVEIETDMSLTSDQQTNDLADIKLHYFVSSINTESFSMEDFVFDLSLKNYSAEFHSAYIDFAKDIDFTQTSDQYDAEYRAFMMESFPLLLKTSPSFNIDQLYFNLISKGELNASLETRIDAIDTLPANPADFLFWMDKIYAQAGLSVDQGVIDYLAYLVLSENIIANAPADQALTEEDIQAAVDAQVQFGIGMLSGMGLIDPTGKGYEIKAEYDHGTTKVNGENFNLPFGGF